MKRNLSRKHFALERPMVWFAFVIIQLPVWAVRFYVLTAFTTSSLMATPFRAFDVCCFVCEREFAEGQRSKC